MICRIEFVAGAMKDCPHKQVGNGRLVPSIWGRWEVGQKNRLKLAC